MLEEIKITLKSDKDELLDIYVDVFDNSLSRKWLSALKDIVRNNLHLEKNFCWLGFVETQRNTEYLCTQMNRAVNAVNSAGLGYVIQDFFSPGNTIAPNGDVIHDKMNALHRYFEDLQGTAGAMSPYYIAADDYTRWHIRQLNLLCHEYESLVLSLRKAKEAPEWRRPSQLMCWLRAPRFELQEEDYEQFGIDTINRSLGGVYVGVNKAVGKHHWEVFNDEGRDSRIGELTTSALRSQTEAAGDFDVEWANNPGAHHWQKIKLAEFREWLIANGFDPDDKSLTIGHPKVGQVDLQRSFGTEEYQTIWKILAEHQDVYKIQIGSLEATYNYNWSDPDYIEQQMRALK